MLLFTRSKGHGSGGTTAIFPVCIVLHRPPPCAEFTKLAQINGRTDSKTVPASKIKGQCAGNAPNILIVANRPRSDWISNLKAVYK